MARVLLFCTAGMAKPSIHSILALNETSKFTTFYFAPSKFPPSAYHDLKTSIDATATIETDFINASEEECQSWTVANYGTNKYIDSFVLAIADDQTATDGSILIQKYEDEQVDVPGYGLLPRKAESWWSFRVEVRAIDAALVAMVGVSPIVVLPTYYGRKEELTDSRGIFDALKAERIIRGED